MRKRSRIILIISIVLLIFGLYYFFYTPRGNNEIYLLPKEYNKTSFIIVYNHPKGVMAKSSSNQIIFRIPKSGILYVKNKIQAEKLFKEKIYFTDINGQITDTINFHSFTDEAINYKKDEIFYFGGYTHFASNEKEYDASIFIIGPIGTLTDDGRYHLKNNDLSNFDVFVDKLNTPDYYDLTK